MEVWCTRKKISIIFTKANAKFCLSLHYNTDNSYLFVNGKKKLNLKPTITSADFVYKVYLMELVILEVSLNGNVYNFSVD